MKTLTQLTLAAILALCTVAPAFAFQGVDPGWNALPPDMREKYRMAGMRAGERRTDPQAKAVRNSLLRVTGPMPPDAERQFLRGLDWSHKRPHSAGGTFLASNGVFEDASKNRSRGAKPMTAQEVTAAKDALRHRAFGSWASRLGMGGVKGGAVGGAVAVPLIAAKHYLAYQDGCTTSEEFVDAAAEDFALFLGGGVVLGVVLAALAFVVSAPTVVTIGAIMAALGIGGVGMEVWAAVEDWQKQAALQIADDHRFGGAEQLSGYLVPLGGLCAVGNVTIAPESQDNPAHWLWAHDESGNLFTLSRDVYRVGTDIVVGPHSATRGWELPPRIGIPSGHSQ